MDGDLLRLHSVLSLTFDEAVGVVIPLSDLEKGYGGYHLTLVGRLLSHRAVNFDAMKGTLIQLFQAARGLELRKISDDRFCLLFNHAEDYRRVLDLRPWIFDKNLVVLAPLSDRDDPLLVNLDWCPFFVHVHDLKLGQRTVEVVRHIGRSLGAWLDEDGIAKDISWFEAVRIRININVTRPFKRALTLLSEHGDELVLRFSYERLPNFYYLCGKLGHISRFCELRFQEGFLDPGVHTPYGAWLRVVGPVRRFGVTPDLVRPTYVRSSSSSLGCDVSVCRGQHIFRGFRCRTGDEVGGASLVAGESGSTAPSPRRLAQHRPLDLNVGQWFFEQLQEAVSGPVPIAVDLDGPRALDFVNKVGLAHDLVSLAHFPSACPGLSRPASPSLGLVDGRPNSRRALSFAGGLLSHENIVHSGGPTAIPEGNLGAKSRLGDHSSWPIVTPLGGLNTDSSVPSSRPVHSDLHITKGSSDFVGSSSLVDVPLITQPSTISAIAPVFGRRYGRRARGHCGGTARRIQGLCVGRGSKRSLPVSLQGTSSARPSKRHLVDELSDSVLDDLGYEGPCYTWCNRRLWSDTVCCRLDRAVGSAAWRSMFPYFDY
ncbi:hypothetical protein Salat_1617200 [Sesamum alatum]|uniref:DUF4283 domain-containing protein n=1 Tax=Sesamum alatum TaxID=300844 RepID=A0AAE1Y5U6_9LAMI|nr:hypothetical protein Salat_1617200 [Sesamum alatum]